MIQRLSDAGLKLKPAKCHFISQEVQYLGHLLTPDGIRPNPDRVAAVKDYPALRSVKEVRQFLGLASYYRRFVKDFARIAQPLHSLTQKGTPFCWSPACEGAFLQLKQRLIESPVLVYPGILSSKLMPVLWVLGRSFHSEPMMVDSTLLPTLVVLSPHRRRDTPSLNLKPLLLCGR